MLDARSRRDILGYADLQIDARFDPQRIEANVDSALRRNGRVTGQIDCLNLRSRCLKAGMMPRHYDRRDCTIWSQDRGLQSQFWQFESKVQ